MIENDRQRSLINHLTGKKIRKFFLEKYFMSGQRKLYQRLPPGKLYWEKPRE